MQSNTKNRGYRDDRRTLEFHKDIAHGLGIPRPARAAGGEEAKVDGVSDVGRQVGSDCVRPDGQMSGR
jgi:hypothetical protein